MMAISSSFWSGLFDFLGRALDFAASVVPRRKSSDESSTSDDAAARAGTAAGAAAHDAGHVVGPAECYLDRGLLRCIKCETALQQELAKGRQRILCPKCGTTINPARRATEREVL
jgi:hypothetical protein